MSHKSRSISVFEDKIVEVDFILSTVSRDPVYIDDVNAYKAYLFSANAPALYTDNEANIVDVLMRIGSFTRRELAGKTIEELKDLRDDIVKRHKNAVIHEQVAEIKAYALYSEIIDTVSYTHLDVYKRQIPGEDLSGLGTGSRLSQQGGDLGQQDRRIVRLCDKGVPAQHDAVELVHVRVAAGDKDDRQVGDCLLYTSRCV